MTKDINYKIEFFSNWHCGSGLAAGADMDLLVVKDKDGLPFVPGKTMKGLVKEMVELRLQYPENSELQKIFQANFGYMENKDKHASGTIYFENAKLAEHERKVISEYKLASHLYLGISSTAIDENGKADNHSLRKMEVVVPCTLEGSIKNVEEELVPAVLDGLKMVKHIGVNRNRGLGRCRITVEEKGGQK